MALIDLLEQGHYICTLPALVAYLKSNFCYFLCLIWPIRYYAIYYSAYKLQKRLFLLCF